MVKIELIDNGGGAFDRYIVIIDDDVYTMSTYPRQPNGFNQYAGKAQDYASFEGTERITVNDEVLRAALERV